jgi:hypothetical protein
MAAVSTIPTSAFPASIPRSVFYGLVKELVHDQTEDRQTRFPNRVSAGAVKLLQRTTEDYITDIFERTETPENKILTVDSFKLARTNHDIDEHTTRLGLKEGEKTILDYNSDNDELME